jgi:hypothetical protein
MMMRRSALWIVVAGTFLCCGCGQTPREQTSKAVAEKSLGGAAGAVSYHRDRPSSRKLIPSLTRRATFPVGELPPGSGAPDATAAKGPSGLATDQPIVLSHSCDLVRGREKLSDVRLASVWNPGHCFTAGHSAAVSGFSTSLWNLN